MHALIVGARGVGKSTLIRRVVEDLGQPVFGFETKKEDSLAQPGKGSPVYIYKAGEEHRQTEDNLVGWCEYKCLDTRVAGFDRFSAHLLAPVPAGQVVVMDEIGVMESSSGEFCRAVLRLLDGEAPVIAAVKDKDTPFLEQVRRHPNCRCFHITPENRETLCAEVSAFMKAQFDERRGL